jgi:hypothetical protein
MLQVDAQYVQSCRHAASTGSTGGNPQSTGICICLLTALLHESATRCHRMTRAWPQLLYSLVPLFLQLLQAHSVVTVGNGTVFRDNAASYGGGIGKDRIRGFEHCPWPFAMTTTVKPPTIVKPPAHAHAAATDMTVIVLPLHAVFSSSAEREWPCCDHMRLPAATTAKCCCCCCCCCSNPEQREGRGVTGRVHQLLWHVWRRHCAAGGFCLAK